MYGINLGCLRDVSDEELSRLPVTYVDGRNDRFASHRNTSLTFERCVVPRDAA